VNNCVLFRKFWFLSTQYIFSGGETFIFEIFNLNIHFCLSNAMHGQNINLPVCVCVCLCVCLCVTISVNSPTGQTPQRIFTVDSLKDADLCKDVPFWGLDDE